MRTSRLAFVLTFVLVFLVSACAPQGSSDGDAFRVAVAQFSHETCTFCPGGDVTVDDWRRSIRHQNMERTLLR